MEYNEFLELSEKTLSNQFHVDGSMPNVLHSVVGMATEIEELMDNYGVDNVMDSVNLAEEIFDIFWYLAILHREFPNIERYSDVKVVVNRVEPFDCVLDLNKSILKLLDHLKKKMFYNKPIDMLIFGKLTLLVETDVYWLLEYYKLDSGKIWDMGIDKLKARYGEKFTSDRAINRDLDTERKILEDGNK